MATLEPLPTAWLLAVTGVLLAALNATQIWLLRWLRA